MFSRCDEKECQKEIVVILPSGFSARKEGKCYCIYWQYEEHPSAMLSIEGITAEKIYKALEIIKRQKGLG